MRPEQVTVLRADRHDTSMMEPFVGEIREFAGEIPPAGWAVCDGRILQINDHRTLFALLGTQFGGDGRWTFALPSLTGSRASVGTNKVARNQRAGETTTGRGPEAIGGRSRGMRFIIALDGLESQD